ncbi:MAG: hypothetical protein ABIF19_16850 [Planctomycetota bacterium]
MEKLMAIMLVLLGMLVGGCEEESVSYQRKPEPDLARQEEEIRVTQEAPSKMAEDPDLTSETLVDSASFESSVAAEPNQPEIKEVNKPIFGVYLGEPFKKLSERAREEWKYDLVQTRESIPFSGLEGATIRVQGRANDGPLYIYLSEPFEERVVMLEKNFFDVSVDRYREIREALKKQYPEADWNEVVGTYAVLRGLVKIDEQVVAIALYCVVGYGNDALQLFYGHETLFERTTKEVELRKEKGLHDNL